ncbi:MAG: carboxypeptidase regulatory-like domain-containing protein [Chitinophagales bacterium]
MTRRFRLLLILTLLFPTYLISAQTGTISGIVIDANNSETLVGATVRVIDMADAIASSDIDGTYRISNVPPGTYQLQVTYVSYQTKFIEGVVVEANNATTVNVALETELTSVFGDSLMVIIKGTPHLENINAMTTFQKNAVAISDVISRDIFTRTPGNNTGDVLKRMSGTTISEGKFAVIRGLSDRYNLALVNGNVLPSTEPDRKAFSFDLFPSALLDNIVVYKAAQPNLPGDFAGGIIMLSTRDIPEENFFSVSAGTGYNTQSTFKEYYTYPGGKTEWLGLDDGTRALPENFPVDRSTLLDLTTAEKAELGKSMAPWGAFSNPSSPVDQAYQLSGGIVQPVGKISEFGLIAAVTYNNSFSTTNAERNDFDSKVVPLYAYNDDEYRNNVLWGGLLNLSFKLNDNNKFSLKNSYSVNSTDLTTMRSGINYSKEVNVRNEYYYFNSNKLGSITLNGDHYFNGSKVKVKWGAGTNTLVRDQPDYRTVNYFQNIIPAFPGDTLFQMSPSPFASPNTIGIFYSYLSEKTYNANLDLTYPFTIGKSKQVFGAGVCYMDKNRSFDAREMGIAASNSIYLNPDYYSIISSPVDQLLSDENFNANTFYVDEITNPSDSYTAHQYNKAAYVMFDNQLGSKVRVAWGVRAEFFNQILHSFYYSASPIPSPVEVNTAETDSVGLPFDFLPSMNITYALSKETNIRVAGYKTVARPELRELAPFGFYDINTNSSVTGNPDLIATNIYNADAKVEHFFGEGQIISGGVFYKKFYNPIGRRFYFGSLIELKPINDSVATCLGVEGEIRKKLNFIGDNNKFLNNLTFSANLALLRSNSILHIADTALAGTSERQLQGQSNYVINLGLIYVDPETGWSASLLFNQIGRRISEYGNAQYPNIFEDPRAQIDGQISMPFAKNRGAFKINLSDLLSQPYIFYQDDDADGKFTEAGDNVIRSINPGTRISFSINYKF